MTDAPLVLLVDDDESFLEIVAMHLRKHSFRTEPALGAAEGLRKAAALQPDLALSDILMPPGPTGWEFALTLRENPATSGIRVAFLTSLSDPWREFGHYRAKVEQALPEAAIFDKCDLEALGARLAALLSPSSPSSS